MTALLRERHRVKSAKDDDFNIRDMTEMTKTLSSTSNLMGSLLLTVALISLVVGGVGIMNIMLVSVTERTREIGLRMAVGARAANILRQFLVEAVVLCLIGGADGHPDGPHLLDDGAASLALADRDFVAGRRGGRPRFRQRGNRLRLLSRLEGLAARPDRSVAVRVTRAAARGLPHTAKLLPGLAPPLHRAYKRRLIGIALGRASG